MANFGSNNILGNQKRRNFIYNPAVSRSRDRNSLAAQPVTSTSGAQLRPSAPNFAHESPYKKFKSNYGLSGKRAEEIAAEEACRDLPVDAFDEDIDEDFDDELLTAEQLDECDRIVSKELQITANLPQKNQRLSVSRNYTPSSSHLDPGQGSSDENDILATHCTQEYPVSLNSSSATSSKAFANFSGTAGFPVSSSRILRAPVVTHPQESVNIVKAMKKSDSLLESFVDHANGSSSFVPNGNVDCVGAGKTANLASNNRNNNYCIAMGDPPEHGQLQSLRKEIEKLKEGFMTANAKVKTLEEEKYCKDGEIRILQDSLSYFEAEKKKRQGEVKATVEMRAREQSQHKKELEKQIENLTTQIQFKDREISQMIERNKKRAGSTETSSTPQKKTVNLSEVFPTGSSFFQKTSPEVKVISPRCTKPITKNMKTLGKHNSQRLSEGDNSENSEHSGTLSGASTLERMKTQRRESETSEREIVQICTHSFPDVELVQNLLSPQDKECPVPFQDPENRMLNEGSIISLLSLDTPFASSQNVMQRATLNETDASHTLHLFDTQATSKLQRSMAVVTQRGSLSDNHDNSLVLQTLSGLLNHSHTDNTCTGESENMKLLSRFQENNLSAASNFLPLLESQITRYVEQRTESNDDNILGTYLPRNSPTPDSPEPRDSPGFESEHAKNLAVLQETALISLKLLNILVLYSCEVCECILKSARVFSETDSNHDENNKRMEIEDERRKMFSSKEEERSFSQHPLFPSLKIAIKKDPDRQKMEVTMQKDTGRSDVGEDVVQHTELLGYLFKLLLPQPKESIAVAYATLQVLTSLTRNCEVKYYTRMLPLLSNSLLFEYLAWDWCLTSLSLVTALLTPLSRHGDIVKRLCSQSDECILLKIYQGWVFRPEDVPVVDYQQVHLQIVRFVNNLLSNSDACMLLTPLESDCQCGIELIKCLVLMLDKVVSPLAPLTSDSLTMDAQNSQSLMLLRQGVFLLATLCLNDRLFAEHRVDVEHQYINVVSCVTRLYKRITEFISDAEVLVVQDLVDLEHIDGIEWSQETDDEINETVEGMDVDE